MMMSDELNRQLKRIPEGYNYAIQVLEENPITGPRWEFQLLADSFLSYIVTRQMATDFFGLITNRPARIVKISRYVPWGGDALVAHSVIRCNAKALKL
jgi:hypothetical protein